MVFTLLVPSPCAMCVCSFSVLLFMSQMNVFLAFITNTVVFYLYAVID